MRNALAAALGTWREGVIPKIHYSSPNTAFEVVETKELGNTGRGKTVQKWKAPPVKAHSDFIDPMEFALFWEAVEGDKRPPFDIMLEAKGKDIALLKLRRDIGRQVEFGAIKPIAGF